MILTAIEAMAEERFNLYGIQATTHVVAPLLIVNGPIVQALDLNGGYNAFGQGWRANATIGRAIRLALINIYENARIPVAKLKLGGMWGMHAWPKSLTTLDDAALLPVAGGKAVKRISISSWWEERASTRCSSPASASHGRSPRRFSWANAGASLSIESDDVGARAV